MATTPDVLHCPHCGHSISDQESSPSELLSYIEQLESYARLPAGLQERLRAGRDFIPSLYMLPVLVARMDHYVSLVNQYAANEPEKIRSKVRAEEYTRLLDQALGEIIPIINQRRGYILELGHASISATWAFPMFDDMLTRAVPTALEIQEALLKLGEELVKSRDLAPKIGITGGWACVDTIGTFTHQSFGAFGPVVIEATRLSGVAEPGQTLVSHTVYEWTKDEIVYDPMLAESLPTEWDTGSEYYLALRRKQCDE